MNILALESSCDETSAAIVANGRTVLSNVIRSQADFHARYGGVIPEFAARQHLDVIHYVFQDALDQAGMTINDIDAFATTLGPGLIGALLVGATMARTLHLLTGKPFLGVNHLYGHVASNYLESDLEPPFICLLVSGGHTQILHVAGFDDIHILGQTLDDAVGECYDKVARMLGLPYPGGPGVDALAQTGNPKAYALPRARTKNPLDFSYSGLKTAVLRLIESQTKRDAQTMADIAASFQEAATQVLIDQTIAAAQLHNIKTIAVAGGVAANSAIRSKFQYAIWNLPGWKLYTPKMIYCTDNAAMIAASAYFNPISRDVGDEVFSR